MLTLLNYTLISAEMAENNYVRKTDPCVFLTNKNEGKILVYLRMGVSGLADVKENGIQKWS